MYWQKVVTSSLDDAVMSPSDLDHMFDLKEEGGIITNKVMLWTSDI